MDRLEKLVRARGSTIFARIDHAAGAALAGLALRLSELLVFGNPRVGTLLVQASPMIGIDLPLKALVWQDDAGKTWVSLVDPVGLSKRYGLATARTDEAAQAMTNFLKDALRSAPDDA